MFQCILFVFYRRQDLRTQQLQLQLENAEAFQEEGRIAYLQRKALPTEFNIVYKLQFTSQNAFGATHHETRRTEFEQPAKCTIVHTRATAIKRPT